MNPVGKALWFVESHFAQDITPEQIASVAGVSRWYMTRAFGAATGLPLMRYLRSRRLGEAARALAAGAPDILAVALEWGYGSHEAFTRAFRDHFGVTPESIRAQGHVNNLDIMEPIRMEQNFIPDLKPARIVDSQPLLIAGVGERYDQQSSAGIPAQWQRFMPHFGHVPGQVGRVAYGVCLNCDDEGNFDYICGVEVRDFNALPEHFARTRIPAQRYAVFEHKGHVSTIRSTWNTIWNQWMPQSGFEAADAPDFERYAEDFDTHTGMGGVEIWIPVK